MSRWEDLVASLRPDLEKVRAIMTHSLRSDIDLLERTNAGLLSHGGKMLRPMLAILSARLCSDGRPSEDAYALAAVSEMLHNATLMHDDVVDGSATRRGRPTVLSLLGGKAAVLLGDFWLVRAVDLLLGLKVCSQECLRLYAKTLSDLAEGEMLQMQKASSGDTTREDYLRIIYSKTASLFEAAVLSAARREGASPERYEALKEYAFHLGLAFQIRDDILDYEGDASLGKPLGQDLLEQKITLPLLCVLEGMPPAEAGALRDRVARAGEDPDEREAIVAQVLSRGGLTMAQKQLSDYIDRAIGALRVFPDGEARRGMETLACFVGERKV